MNVTITPPSVTVTVSPPALGKGFGNPVARDLVERDPYVGDYTITPAEEQVVLTTDGKRMTDNITVDPIPENYCRWSWDGSKLTVY